MRNATRNGRRKRMTIETNGRRKRMTIETLAADWFPERPRGMHLPLKFQTETLLEVRPPNSPRSRRYLMARAPRAREIRTFPHGTPVSKRSARAFAVVRPKLWRNQNVML
jgi:hypothetical protein